MLHGVENYFVRGEGTLEAPLIPPEVARTRSFSRASGQQSRDPLFSREARILAPPAVFSRMFAKGAQPDAESLINLGLAMETDEQGDALPDSATPAGYTYLGQFIDHDITFDQTPLTGGGTVEPGTIINHRSPTLDLDSVYGAGPSASPSLYETDGFTLRVGVCVPSNDADGAPIAALPNDLPRQNLIAVIADKRNDENLALAQLHLAFIKYHNTVAKQIQQASPSKGAEEIFGEAQTAVVQRYQRIVLTDFLPKIIDISAVERVLAYGHVLFKPENHDTMPVEFSAAAYRFGHSMIRPVYDWNRVFHSRQGPKLAESTLELLFEFTQFSGLTAPADSPFFGSEGLPSNWAVDWRMMFEVDGAPPADGFVMNMARPVDTTLANPLAKLPEFAGAGVTEAAFLSLASRNLLRGRLLSLPDGLSVAQAMADAGLPIRKLSEDELKGGPLGPTLYQQGLLDTPPLWYYILREAEIDGGNRLGPVGSAIVAETLVAHIRNANISVLKDGNVKRLDQLEPFTMSTLLKEVNDLAPA